MKKIPNWIITVVVIALVIASKFILFAPKEDVAAAGKGKPKGPGQLIIILLSLQHLTMMCLPQEKLEH